MVRDEVRRVLCNDDAFAETVIGEMRDAIDYGAIGIRRGDDFDQPQVPGWVEEMCPEKMAAEVVAAAFGELRDRQARRVGADDRSGLPHGLDALEQRALD